MVDEENIYELGYLLTPLVAADKATETVDQIIKALITGAPGQIKQEHAPRLMTLAYPIKQVVEHKGTTFREAYFGSIYFTATPEALEKVMASLKKSSEIIRHLLVKASRDLGKPEVRRAPRPKAALVTPVSSPAEKPVMTTAAIDQEIENLIHVSQ